MPSDERRRAAARARLLSRFQKALPPLPSFAVYKREYPLAACFKPPSAAFSPRVTVVVVGRSLSVRCSRTDGHMRASTRLWWLLIPPGASLVTHAAPRAILSRAPHPSLSLRQAHASPTCGPLSLLSFLSSLPPFFSLSFSFFRPLSLLRSPRFLHPATLYRRASGDTRGPTQVMHGPPYIFDPLFGLFFPTGSDARCLSPSTLRSPPRPPMFLFLLALSRAGKITIVRVSLSRSCFSVLVRLSRSCATRRGSERTSTVRAPVTPVIVRLLTGMCTRTTRRAELRASPRCDGPCAHVFTRALCVTRGHVGSLLRRRPRNRPFLRTTLS